MSFHHPQTPQSPSQSSPGVSDPLASMTSSMTTMTSALPTPAHSVNGSTSQPFDTAHDVSMGDNTPHKRKRSGSDIGERDQKKIHLDTPVMGFDDLHLEVGEKFLLCETPLQMPKYTISNDLFEMFDLTGLATKMAREKANGEKNALRKSFKSQVKDLNIDGAYDTKRDEVEEHDPESFTQMLAPPEDYWYATEVKGKEVSDGLQEGVKSLLPKAMTMAKGKLRKEHWDSYMLGALDTPSAQLGDSSGQPGSAKATEPNTPAASTPSASAMMARAKASSQTLAQGQDPSRPRRNIKKRSYGDSSFEGYGEGFPDDDGGLDTGYSTGEGDERSGQKRRKKVGICDIALATVFLTAHRIRLVHSHSLQYGNRAMVLAWWASRSATQRWLRHHGRNEGGRGWLQERANDPCHTGPRLWEWKRHLPRHSTARCDGRPPRKPKPGHGYDATHFTRVFNA